MRYEEYFDKLKQNPEYVEAEKELRFRFRLAEAVLMARIEKGWSQGELAEVVGTKQANISRIEGGLANPTLDFVRRLCDVLDLEASFLDRRDFELISTKSEYAETTTVTLSAGIERIDNQDDNVFIRPRLYSTYSDSSSGEGVLK